jgi:hypothetical protein
MAKILIDFEWHRDSKGYRLLDAESRKADGRVPTILDAEKSTRIVRCGGDLILCRPLEDFEFLYREFAKIRKTPEGVLDFIQKFGSLTVDRDLDARLKGKASDHVNFVLDQSKEMSDLLAYVKDPKKNLKNLIGIHGIKISAIDALVTIDPITNKPRLKFTPRNLLNALWLQAFQALSSDAQVRQCQQCDTWFEVGSGTGRRLDAVFCSKEHQVLFNRLKRAKKG